MRFAQHKRYAIWQYLCAFRYAQYYNVQRMDRDADRLRRSLARILFRYYDRRRNLCGERAGVEIGLGSRIGAGLDIWHGGVVINGNLGERCVLHGNNVIGNKGKSGHNEIPEIGAGADIGANAVIIGGVTLAENCTVGAGAVVTRSCETPGAVLAGVPARNIRKNTEGTNRQT